MDGAIRQLIPDGVKEGGQPEVSVSFGIGGMLGANCPMDEVSATVLVVPFGKQSGKLCFPQGAGQTEGMEEEPWQRQPWSGGAIPCIAFQSSGHMGWPTPAAGWEKRVRNTLSDSKLCHRGQ